MAWTVERWQGILGRWEGLVARAARSGPDRDFRFAPVSAADVAALEAGLRRPLPPSYRSFLEVSDGVAATVWGPAHGYPGEPVFDGFLPARLVRSVVRSAPGTIMFFVLPDDVSVSPLFDPGPGFAQYLLPATYGAGGYPCLGHLLHAIAVNGAAVHGNVYLDPLVVDADGEWEAWRWDADGCERFHSFGALFEDLLDRMEEAISTVPVVPSGEPWTRITELLAIIDRDEAEAAAASDEVERCCLEGELSERRTWAWQVGTSQSDAVGRIAVRLLGSHPGDPAIVRGIVDGFGAWWRAPGAFDAVRGALRGPCGQDIVNPLVYRWPEPVEAEYGSGGDVAWIGHLLGAQRPGSVRVAIEALERRDLDPQVRNDICSMLNCSTAGHPDPSEIGRVVRLADVAGTNRFHLTEALIGWAAEPEAVAMLERAVFEGGNSPGNFATDNYVFEKLVL